MLVVEEFLVPLFEISYIQALKCTLLFLDVSFSLDLLDYVYIKMSLIKSLLY